MADFIFLEPVAPSTRPSLEHRLWSRFEKSEDCWKWTGYTNQAGYGRIGIGGSVSYAHRAAWIVTNGPIAAGLQVLHTCDTPSCCRPSHLYLGTPAHNMDDRDRRGRTSRGLRHAAAVIAGMKRARLTERAG